jgi:hypothetical protein
LRGLRNDDLLIVDYLVPSLFELFTVLPQLLGLVTAALISLTRWNRTALTRSEGDTDLFMCIFLPYCMPRADALDGGVVLAGIYSIIS